MTEPVSEELIYTVMRRRLEERAPEDGYTLPGCRDLIHGICMDTFRELGISTDPMVYKIVIEVDENDMVNIMLQPIVVKITLSIGLVGGE